MDVLTNKPICATLPPELLEIQKEWLAAQNEKNARMIQDKIYAEKFAPHYAKIFATLPLYRAPATMEHPKALVSLLGLSWQPESSPQKCVL